MGSLSAVREGLKTRLEAIPGLKGYASAPGQILPKCAVVLPGQIAFDDTMDRGSDRLTFDVLLIVARATDELAQEQLDPYLAGSGQYSVKAAIEGDGTLGGSADWTVVRGVMKYGQIDYSGVDYFGARFAVEVSVDGT